MWFHVPEPPLMLQVPLSPPLCPPYFASLILSSLRNISGFASIVHCLFSYFFRLGMQVRLISICPFLSNSLHVAWHSQVLLTCTFSSFLIAIPYFTEYEDQFPFPLTCCWVFGDISSSWVLWIILSEHMYIQVGICLFESYLNSDSYYEWVHSYSEVLNSLIAKVNFACFGGEGGSTGYQTMSLFSMRYTPSSYFWHILKVAWLLHDGPQYLIVRLVQSWGKLPDWPPQSPWHMVQWKRRVMPSCLQVATCHLPAC